MRKKHEKKVNGRRWMAGEAACGFGSARVCLEYRTSCYKVSAATRTSGDTSLRDARDSVL
ncbi:hypothetical protein E2C01_014341 [Portunus trituberculatus]|uniref:Uncharacterized protein n=1 Tax=Portunus trituberculatus TaxID=210409 RepID=A0A5B7DIY2_PORTR|nr:hypothetical protein [Portunus trituberculatus]